MPQGETNMPIEDDLARLKHQEQALVFARFDEAEAFALGTRLRDIALERDLPITVQVDLWDRPLFYAALPGSTAGNREWARRKINSVRLYQKSTYRMFVEQGAGERIFGADFGHDARDFAIAGGALPIRVDGSGAIGVVAVSGLPQRDDHSLVVEALADHLGIDIASVALTKAGD
jgi:uncharacterized protein (UPF0303 family)